jgi:hypothetical protein
VYFAVALRRIFSFWPLAVGWLRVGVDLIIMQLFTHYEEWRRAITEVCGMDLTRDYCETRIAALGDESDPATQAFLTSYGAGYRDTVQEWFRRAEREALS